MSDVLKNMYSLIDSDVLTAEQREVVVAGANEIERLRKLAGVVSTTGEDLAAIKARVHPGRAQ